MRDPSWPDRESDHRRPASELRYATGGATRRPLQALDTAFIFWFFSEELYMTARRALQTVWLTQQPLGNPFPQGVRHPISAATVRADYGLASGLEPPRLGRLDRGFDSALDCFDRGFHKKPGLELTPQRRFLQPPVVGEGKCSLLARCRIMNTEGQLHCRQETTWEARVPAHTNIHIGGMVSEALGRPQSEFCPFRATRSGARGYQGVALR